MTAPAPEKCDVCGASPVELVLYPVAIHYKGSGFYTTDYGKGEGAKKDGEGGSSGGERQAAARAAKTDSKPRREEGRRRAATERLLAEAGVADDAAGRVGLALRRRLRRRLPEHRVDHPDVLRCSR